MFTPNLVGQISARTKRDVHGRIQWGAPRPCPFGIVNFDLGAQKTSVRADSSASRGTADETVAMRAKILIAPQVSVRLGDRFEFEGEVFVIAAVHARRSVVTGRIDHFECGLEIMP